LRLGRLGRNESKRKVDSTAERQRGGLFYQSGVTRRGERKGGVLRGTENNFVRERSKHPETGKDQFFSKAWGSALGVERGGILGGPRGEVGGGKKERQLKRGGTAHPLKKARVRLPSTSNREKRPSQEIREGGKFTR